MTDARAFHGAETYFVTGNLQTLGTSVPYSSSSAEIALSEAMMGYWSQLAATGDPNGTGAPHWTPYDENNEDVPQLDDTIANMPGGYRNALMRFLSTLPTRGF